MKILSRAELDEIGLPHIQVGLADFIELMNPGYDGPVRFDLIDAKIAWAESENEKPIGDCLWNQAEWAQNTACGTARCIAGDTVIEVYGIGALRDIIGGRGPEAVYDIKTVETEQGLETISDAATRILGIRKFESFDDYPEMFDPDNNLADLKRIRDAYARAEGYPEKYAA